MTQHGPYPGQSSQPWSAGGGGDPYREPSDPWAGPAPEAEYPGRSSGEAGYSLRPTGAEAGYPPRPAGPPRSTGTEYGRPAAESTPAWTPAAESTPAWTAPTSSASAEPAVGTPPPPPRRRGRDTRVTMLVVLVALLFCGGLGTSAWLLIHSPSPSDHAQATTPTPTVGQTVAPTNANPAPPPSSKDARFVAKGQCVRNEGTAAAPDMAISVCASGSYQVLARIDGRTTGEADAEAKCAKVPNYSKWYLYDSDLDSLDFVLCLKER